jgi:succinyl-CoA synthetase alpha subunit
MSILIDENSRVMVQAITGSSGSFHTRRMIDYRTNIVAGTSPGKGGQEVEGVPVYNTVRECIENEGANVSVLFLPARFVLDSTMEAIDAGIPFVVVVPEHIPIHDMLKIRDAAQATKTTVIGGNTPGIISPGKCNVGIIPDIAFKQGKVGTVSRSGSILYYVANTLTDSGWGETTCVGMGGDPILGSTFSEILALFENDPETLAVVMMGEIGGVYEEMAGEQIASMDTPVIAMIGGMFAPRGKRMGHAGAIVEGSMGTAESKVNALKEAGAHIAKTFLDRPEILDDVVEE